MATPDTRAEITLRLERTIAAPPEKVFEAWTRPEVLSRWFAPSDEYEVVVTHLEPRPGGRLRLEMRHRGGNVHVASATFLEVKRPERLVLAWGWEGKPEEGESQVRLMIAEALHATGDADARSSIRAARERLLARAAKITSPEWRTSFLENLPENARTLALARELLGA